MQTEKTALFLGATLKDSFVMTNGKTIPERVIISFLTEEMETLEFTLPEMPEWASTMPTFTGMTLGVVKYEIVRDNYGSKPGRAQFRAIFSEFASRTKVSLSSIKAEKSNVEK